MLRARPFHKLTTSECAQNCCSPRELAPLFIQSKNHSEEPTNVLCGNEVSIFLDRDQMPYGASHAYAQHIVELKLPYMEESQLWWYLKFVNKSMEDLEELSHRCPDSLHRCLAQDHGQKWLRVHEALDARWHVAEDVTASTALPPAPPTALAASTQVLEVAAAPAAPAAPNGLKLEGAEVPLDAAMTTATTTATTTTTPPPPPPPTTTMPNATPTTPEAHPVSPASTAPVPCAPGPACNFQYAWTQDGVAAAADAGMLQFLHNPKPGDLVTHEQLEGMALAGSSAKEFAELGWTAVGVLATEEAGVVSLHAI